MSDEGNPVGFEQKGIGPETEMDRLAKAMFESGSKSVGEQRAEAMEAQARGDAAMTTLAEKVVEAAEEEEEVVETDEESPEEISAESETEEEPAAEGEDAGEVEVEGEEGEEEDEEGVEMVELSDGSKLPLKEVTDGYLRQSDYTKKTQELAEQRKTFESDKNGYIEKQAQVGQYITQLAQKLENQIKQEADPQTLEELRVSDPAEYSARMIEAQRKQELVNAAKAQHQALYNQQRMEIVQRERASLAAKHEGFATDFDKTYGEITQWVTDPKGGGLPAEMWDQIFDHRAVLLVEKAMKHDRAAKVEVPKVTRKLAKVPKVVRPGRKVSTRQTETNEYADALSKAKLSGSVDDLAKAFALKAQMQRKALKK